MESDLNPLVGICAEIRARIESLEKEEKRVAAELEWYRTTDPAALRKAVEEDEAEAERIRSEVESLDRQIQGVSASLRRVQSGIRTLLNPFNWFDSHQCELRAERARLRRTLKQMNAEKHSRIKAREEILARVARTQAEITRHASFDAPEKERQLTEIRKSRQCERENLAKAIEEKRHVDEQLEPLLAQMHTLESRRKEVSSALEAAQALEDRLSSAESAYEKAMIHQECESMFDERRPHKVIHERRRELRQIDRDYEKLLSRAKEIGQRGARRIKRIIIDGNNLCYEDSEFIGLAALRALLPALLARKYEVVVVFDAAIRRLTNARDADIERQLGGGAKVHVVAARRRADETILDLAATDEYTYVLSNDRFADFGEKPVVMQNRLLRHEIVDGEVLVHDLGIRAKYK